MYFKRILLIILLFFISACNISDIIEYNTESNKYDIVEAETDTAKLCFYMNNDIQRLIIDIDTCWIYNIYLLDDEFDYIIFNDKHKVLFPDSSIYFPIVYLSPQHILLWNTKIDPYNKAYIKMLTNMIIYGDTLYNGYKIGNVDATVIAQAPKMAPYIMQMRENIAKALETDIENVSVKATTEEKLGFTGEGLGISAHAVCILEKI